MALACTAALRLLSHTAAPPGEIIPKLKLYLKGNYSDSPSSHGVGHVTVHYELEIFLSSSCSTYIFILVQVFIQEK